MTTLTPIAHREVIVKHHRARAQISRLGRFASLSYRDVWGSAMDFSSIYGAVTSYGWAISSRRRPPYAGLRSAYHQGISRRRSESLKSSHKRPFPGRGHRQRRCLMQTRQGWRHPSHQKDVSWHIRTSVNAIRLI